jgi:hypothetical protein
VLLIDVLLAAAVYVQGARDEFEVSRKLHYVTPCSFCHMDLYIVPR